MGQHLVLILASETQRLCFMSINEKEFLLRWVTTISAAEEVIKRERFDFALVNFDLDPQRAIQFCENLKKIQPDTKVIFLKTDFTPLPENFCADLVLESGLSENEIAMELQKYVRLLA